MIFLFSLFLVFLFADRGFSETCSRFACSTGTCQVELLTLFIIDCSGSVGTSDFSLAKDFTKNVINSFSNFDPRIIRNSYLTFDDKVYLHTEFSQSISKSDILSGIDGIKYRGGGTNIDQALQASYQSFMSYPVNSGIQKIMAFMTDGKSTIDAQNAKNLHNYGVKVFAIGVGSADRSQLEIIASDTSLVFVASTYADLGNIESKFIKTVCDEPTVSPTNQIITSQLTKKNPKYYEFNTIPGSNMKLEVVSNGAKVQMYVSKTVKNPSVAENIASHNGVPLSGAASSWVVVPASSGTEKLYATLYSETDTQSQIQVIGCNPTQCKVGNNEDTTVKPASTFVYSSSSGEDTSGFSMGLAIGLGAGLGALTLIIIIGIVVMCIIKAKNKVRSTPSLQANYVNPNMNQSPLPLKTQIPTQKNFNISSPTSNVSEPFQTRNSPMINASNFNNDPPSKVEAGNISYTNN